jgi:hypothetical protein
MAVREDLSGRVFNMLTVIDYAGPGNGTKRRSMWNCICECGKRTVVVRECLVSGKYVSCGCWRERQNIIRRTTHGETCGRRRGGRDTRLYKCWTKAVSRCKCPTDPKFPTYSVRGIDPRWLKFENFRDDILKHIGPHPGAGYSIHRIDNDMGYWMFHPVTGEQQVKWATASEQARVQGKRKGSSQYRGVHLNKAMSKKRNKYQIAVTPLGGRQTHFGTFDNELEAALMRDIIEVRLCTGSPLNFPELLPKFKQYIACEDALAELNKPFQPAA